MYSYIIAMIIAIAEQQLTRLHATFALVAAGSPFSLYILVYCLLWTFKVLKSDRGRGEVREGEVTTEGNVTTKEKVGTGGLSGKEAKKDKAKTDKGENFHRLYNVFGDGQWFNRALVLAIVPAWFAVLVFICLPAEEFRFQQSACDAVFKNHLVGSFFYGPLLVFVGAPPPAIITGALLLGLLVFSWMVGAFLHRGQIRKQEENDSRFYLMRVWFVISVSTVMHCDADSISGPLF